MLLALLGRVLTSGLWLLPNGTFGVCMLCETYWARELPARAAASFAPTEQP